MTISERVGMAIQYHGGLRKAAVALDINPGYLSRLNSGEKKNPSEPVLIKLGLRKEINYVLR